MNIAESAITNEFTYFYFKDGKLERVGSLYQVPEEEGVAFCKLADAIGYVQKLGCCGMSQHKIRNEYHHLCLEVLRWYVDNFGETFPLIFRGVRNERPDSEHLILFGTRDIEVAKFYGSTIKKYTNIKGLRTASYVKSVKTEDWSEADDEIIFFPTA